VNDTSGLLLPEHLLLPLLYLLVWIEILRDPAVSCLVCCFLLGFVDPQVREI
jgi:hypothetical protein